MADLFASSGARADDYSAKDIEVLEGLEPVRRRPGMYVGGVDERALHHLVAEVLDNSMDEAVAGHASRIELELAADHTVTVRDNGRGIPVDPHPKFPTKSALEVILTTLHSGGKFSDKVYATAGGLHGVPEGFHVTAVYELCDVNVGDGGFGCIPGSHDFTFNKRVLRMGKGWNANWVDSPWQKKMDNWPADVPVHSVADEAGGLRAGDCIIFSERTKHGTLPWTGAGERRTLFYKYVPYGFHHEDPG